MTAQLLQSLISHHAVGLLESCRQRKETRLTHARTCVILTVATLICERRPLSATNHIGHTQVHIGHTRYPYRPQLQDYPRIASRSPSIFNVVLNY